MQVFGSISSTWCPCNNAHALLSGGLRPPHVGARASARLHATPASNAEAGTWQSAFVSIDSEVYVSCGHIVARRPAGTTAPAGMLTRGCAPASGRNHRVGADMTDRRGEKGDSQSFAAVTRHLGSATLVPQHPVSNLEAHQTQSCANRGKKHFPWGNCGRIADFQFETRRPFTPILSSGARCGSAWVGCGRLCTDSQFSTKTLILQLLNFLPGPQALSRIAAFVSTRVDSHVMMGRVFLLAAVLVCGLGTSAAAKAAKPVSVSCKDVHSFKCHTVLVQSAVAIDA